MSSSQSCYHRLRLGHNPTLSPRTPILTRSTSRPKLSLRGLRTSCTVSEPETTTVRPTRLKLSHTSRPLITMEQGWAIQQAKTLQPPPESDEKYLSFQPAMTLIWMKMVVKLPVNILSNLLRIMIHLMMVKLNLRSLQDLMCT